MPPKFLGCSTYSSAIIITSSGNQKEENLSVDFTHSRSTNRLRLLCIWQLAAIKLTVILYFHVECILRLTQRLLWLKCKRRVNFYSIQPEQPLITRPAPSWRLVQNIANGLSQIALKYMLFSTPRVNHRACSPRVWMCVCEKHFRSIQRNNSNCSNINRNKIQSLSSTFPFKDPRIIVRCLMPRPLKW